MKILSYFKAQILLILIIFAAQPYQAQITEEDFKNPLKNLIPPSPTAAALAEYADVPVSEYTGIPSIQIPIYNYSSGTLDLPINLSYHASGIKVDEVASWVGLGWSLNAGGMITKSIRGLEDNVPNGYQDNPIFNTFDGTVLDLYNNAPEVEAMMRGDLDGEPDIYYFNFNGNSGKFVFDHNDQIRLIPHSDLKIERDLSLGFGEQGFIITDTKGIKYYFGGQYKERTYTSVVSGPNSQGPCVGDFSPPQNGGLTGWYLYKIEDPISEDYIELDYLPYTIDFDQGMNANAYMDNPVSIGAHESICVNAPGNTECITHQSSQSHSLSRITSNSGISIEFKRDSQRDDVMGGVKLNSIELFDRSGGLMKWFNLSYDYMISAGAYPGNHEMSKRLKLRSVEEKTSLISKPPYILEYTDDLSSTQKLPLRLSYAQDHWGFYNGKNQNNTMLPKRVYHHHGFEGSDRDANPSTVTAGMLSKIIYPTGGNVSFDFECNDIGYFSSSSILNWNSFYSNKQVEIEAYRDVNGGSAYAHIIDTFYIPYALEATYSIETRNDQLGTNEWNGNIWVTHLESGQGACLFQGGNIPCAGNLNGLDIWLSGTYIVEMEAIAPGDYANMHVEWEQHDISSNEMDLAALDALPVGGVRIGKITYHDGISSASDRVVQYEYVQNDNVSNPNLSSGRLLDFPRYDWVMRMYRELPSWGDPNDPMNMPDCANRVCRFNALNSSSKTPLGASNGSHVVYPEVNVIYGASAEGGKTIKTFSYANDWGGSGFPFTFKTNMDWKRGKLLSQKDFKKNPNGSFSLVREVYNEWDFREDETVNNNTIIGLKVDKRIQGGQCFYASTYTCDPTNVTEVYYGNCVTASVDLGNLLTGSSPLELDTSSGFFSSAGLTGIEAAFAAINCDTVGTHVCFGQQPGTLLNNPLWGEEIAYRSYEVNSQWTYLKSSTEIVDGVKKVTEYVYDETAGHHTNPIETITYGSDGTTYRTKNTYAFSMHQNAGVLTPEVAGIEALKQFHINVPIEHVQTIQKINGQEKTISGTLVEFGDENGKPTKKAVWTLETSAPISNFTNAHVFDYNNVGTLYKSANYVNNGDDAPEFEYISYNNKNQLLEYKSHFGETNSIIWKSDINKPVATITNATHNEVLYTSFESTHDNGLGLKLNMGSFVYNNSKCGSKSYQLGTNATVKIEFIPVGTYRLSYWQTSGNCDIRLNGSLLKSKSVPGTVNGFKKQDMIIEVPTGGSVLIMEGNSILDELRMYPEDARMKSFVYDLDDIKVVAISDENNIPSTYAYDAFNRLVMIKDFNEDIIQTMEYAIDQTSSLNAITEKTITVEGIKTLSQVNGLNNKEALQSVTYLDGFSRPIQKVLVAQSPGERDIVEITEYDNLGLNPKTYLPFTTGTMGGAFISNAKIAQNIFHGGNLVQNSFAYAEAVKEASPLARDLSTGSPGKAWAIGEGHERFMNYRTNALNEVRLFSNGTSTGAYDDSTLFVSQIIDEDGNSITMYKDKLGREIMQDNEGAKTYTIYDDFGRIAVVIPPQLFDDMSKDNNFNYLSPTYKLGTYNYTYDARGRLIRKDLPGSDVHQFYYDRLDREVLSIDPNDNKIFAKYDILGREIMTGSYNGTAVPSNADGLYELENNSLNGYSTSNAFPSANTEIYTVTYFDHYDFNRNGQSETIELFKPQAGSMYSLAASSNTIGLATGSKIAVFDEKNNPFQYLTSSTFIDEKSRVIQTKSENILNEVDINSFSFDFLGNVQNEKKEQRATFASGATKSYVIDKRYTYDHTGRLIDTYHTINSGNEVLLSRNSYDEKSQLKRKSLGGKSGSNQFLQNIDYKYNIRGWLTDINDINKKGVIDVQVGSGSSSNNK